jgi:hypothetical protein
MGPVTVIHRGVRAMTRRADPTYCDRCEGASRKTCPACQGRGFVSRPGPVIGIAGRAAPTLGGPQACTVCLGKKAVCSICDKPLRY